MLTYTLDVSEFTDLFDTYGRGDNFTSAARRALFDYLDNLSDDIGQNAEIDIIALCCEWSEYSQDELVEQFSHLVDLSDVDEDEHYQTVLDTVDERTICFEVNQVMGEDTVMVIDF